MKRRSDCGIRVSAKSLGLGRRARIARVVPGWSNPICAQKVCRKRSAITVGRAVGFGKVGPQTRHLPVGQPDWIRFLHCAPLLPPVTWFKEDKSRRKSGCHKRTLFLTALAKTSHEAQNSQESARAVSSAALSVSAGKNSSTLSASSVSSLTVLKCAMVPKSDRRCPPKR